MELESYISTLQDLASKLKANPSTRRDTAEIRNLCNGIQTSCQHIFTEVKALNRMLPQ